MKGAVDLIEKLCSEVEMVNGICYSGDRLNFGGGCEATVTAKVRVDWVRFRECRKSLLENSFFLKIKFMVVACDQQYCMEARHDV